MGVPLPEEGKKKVWEPGMHGMGGRKFGFNPYNIINTVKPLLEFSLVSTFISLLCFINYRILTEKNWENKINTELQES